MNFRSRTSGVTAPLARPARQERRDEEGATHRTSVRRRPCASACAGLRGARDLRGSRGRSAARCGPCPGSGLVSDGETTTASRLARAFRPREREYLIRHGTKALCRQLDVCEIGLRMRPSDRMGEPSHPRLQDRLQLVESLLRAVEDGPPPLPRLLTEVRNEIGRALQEEINSEREEELINSSQGS